MSEIDFGITQKPPALDLEFEAQPEIHICSQPDRVDEEFNIVDCEELQGVTAEESAEAHASFSTYRDSSDIAKVQCPGQLHGRTHDHTPIGA